MVGLDTRNKAIVAKIYLCDICGLLLRDPVQFTDCGHRRCQSCIPVQHRDVIKCTECSETIASHHVKIDRGFRREMEALSVDCSLCHWCGSLKNYQGHLNQSHLIPECEHCDQLFMSVDKLNEHKVSECQKLTLSCFLEGYGCKQKFYKHCMLVKQ